MAKGSQKVGRKGGERTVSVLPAGSPTHSRQITHVQATSGPVDCIEGPGECQNSREIDGERGKFGENAEADGPEASSATNRASPIGRGAMKDAAFLSAARSKMTSILQAP